MSTTMHLLQLPCQALGIHNIDFRRYLWPGNGLRDFESPHRLSKRVEGLGVELSSGQECGRTTALFQLVHENLGYC
jgi:hypothetical protein